MEAESRAGREQRQLDLGEQFIGRERRAHHSAEKLGSSDAASAARAAREHAGAKSCGDQAPFGRRVGVRQAAAKRAARADRMVRDVLHHARQQFAERTRHDGALEGAVAHAGADVQVAVARFERAQRRDFIDIDEMRRCGETQCHRRHQALAAGEDAAFAWSPFTEQRQRLVEAARRVVLERRGLQAPMRRATRWSRRRGRRARARPGRRPARLRARSTTTARA